MLEPPGARPVIVEDDAFVGAGSALLEGVLVGRGAVIGAGVTLTGTSRLYDLVRGRVLAGTTERPLVVPPGAVVVPGARLRDGPFAARARPVRLRSALLVKDRDAGTCRAGRPRGGPPMSHSTPPSTGAAAATRSPRAAARRATRSSGRAGSAASRPEELATRFGTPLYVYDLDVIERPGRGAARRPAARVDLAYAVKANPALAVVAHLGRLGTRRRRRLGRRAGDGRCGPASTRPGS